MVKEGLREKRIFAKDFRKMKASHVDMGEDWSRQAEEQVQSPSVRLLSVPGTGGGKGGWRAVSKG